MGPNRVAWLERGLQALSDLDLPEPVKTAIVGMLSLHLLTEGQAAVAFQDLRRAGIGSPQTAPQHPAVLDFGAMLTAATNPSSIQPSLRRSKRVRSMMATPMSTRSSSD